VVTGRTLLNRHEHAVQHYDVIVVGAGTAGCLVAAGVVTGSDATVLLVEEGPDRTPGEVRLLARQQEARSGELVRRLRVDEDGDGRSRTLLTGRVLGGGWSIGHAAIVSPTDRDLVALSECAGAASGAWRPDAVRARIARRIRDLDHPKDGATDPNGARHRIPVRRTYRAGEPVPPAVEDLLVAAGRHGLDLLELDLLEDVDRGGGTVGVCAYPQSAVDGERRSSASEVLGPARGHARLTVLGGTVVERIVLDRGRVTAVRLTGSDGESRTVGAGLVVLAAGAYHTPELLLRSGIGPAETLAAAGIPVLHHLPGVGRGLRDHARVELHLPMSPAPSDEGRRFGDALRLHLRARTSLAQDDPDVDLSLRHPKGRSSVVLMVRLLEQRAAGEVTLAGPTAGGTAGALRVRTGLAADGADLVALREGLEIGTSILMDGALRGRHRLDGPLLSVSDLQRTVAASGHGVGTCRIGEPGDPERVVDADLAVDGLDGLLIADASVLPVLPHAGPIPAVVSVAEHAVDRIRARFASRGSGSLPDEVRGN
jgi:choline dehydrogenase